MQPKKSSPTKKSPLVGGPGVWMKSVQGSPEITNIQINERFSSSMRRTQNQSTKNNLAQQFFSEPLFVQSRGIDKYLKKPPTPTPGAKSVQSREGKQLEKSKQKDSLNAPNSLPTGIASSQAKIRGENTGTAQNSLPSRPGSKVQVAGAVLSNRTLFSQHTGSFGSHSQFQQRRVMAPRVEAPQIAS